MASGKLGYFLKRIFKSPDVVTNRRRIIGPEGKIIFHGIETTHKGFVLDQMIVNIDPVELQKGSRYAWDIGFDYV